jgi:hypothetical protein
MRQCDQEKSGQAEVEAEGKPGVVEEGGTRVRTGSLEKCQDGAARRGIVQALVVNGLDKWQYHHKSRVCRSQILDDAGREPNVEVRQRTSTDLLMGPDGSRQMRRRCESLTNRVTRSDHLKDYSDGICYSARGVGGVG